MLDKLLAEGLTGTIPHGFHSCRHGSGRGRGLGSDPENAWPFRARSRARAGDPHGRARLRRSRRASRSTGRSRPSELRKDKGATLALSARTASRRRRRHRAVAGAGRNAETRSRKNGAREFYEDRHRRGHRRHRRAARQHAGRVRFRRASRRGGDADLHRVIAASTWSNCRRTGRGSRRLVLLNILERFDMAAARSARRRAAHIALEAARLAYAVRDTHIADPAFMRMAVPRLLDRDFAADLADMIDRTQALEPAAGARSARRHDAGLRRRPRPQRGVNDQFAVRRRSASAVATEKTGIMLHNRGMGLLPRSEASELRRPEQAPDAHHHSRARHARRALRDGVRRDGRLVSVAWGTRISSPISSITAWTCRRRSTRRVISSKAQKTLVERGVPAERDRRPQEPRARCGDPPAAARRRPGDPDRLGARRADRRLRRAQGWLRARLLKSEIPQRSRARPRRARFGCARCARVRT